MLVTFLVDRPLSLGILRLELMQKTERLRQLPSPKLIILAGSNGPYSHSCQVIGTMLDLPCENAGIAVGFGLDEIFVHYEPYISVGDIVYMPMEFQQYTTTRSEYAIGPDGAMLIRHDRILLMQLPPSRTIGAFLCCNLADFLEASIEMPLTKLHLLSPSRILASEYNVEGDRMDNFGTFTASQIPSQQQRKLPTALDVSSGYGTAQIAAFVEREENKKIIVIGGLPADFDTLHETPDLISAIRSIYLNHGGNFVMLPNRSQYPQADFFNSEDHLTTQCQLLHSILIAEILARKLHREVLRPSQNIITIAATCPSVPVNFAQLSAMGISQADVQNSF